MFAKLMFVLVAVAAIGAGLLALRQQRLAMMHDMAELHEQMDATRKQTWRLQSQIAEQTRPDALREALHRAELEVEPITPQHLIQPQPEPPVARAQPTRPGALTTHP